MYCMGCNREPEVTVYAVACAPCWHSSMDATRASSTRVAAAGRSERRGLAGRTNAVLAAAQHDAPEQAAQRRQALRAGLPPPQHQAAPDAAVVEWLVRQELQQALQSTARSASAFTGCGPLCRASSQRRPEEAEAVDTVLSGDMCAHDVSLFLALAQRSAALHKAVSTAMPGAAAGRISALRAWRTWISSTLEVIGVPVTTQAWRRHSAEVICAATLEDCATSCASSSTTRQNPNCSSSDLRRHPGTHCQAQAPSNGTFFSALG